MSKATATEDSHLSLFATIHGFKRAAVLVELEIARSGIRSKNDSERLEPMKIVSHFNLATAIELMLKLVLIRNKISWNELPQKHSLSMLFDKVPHDWKTKLHDSYSVCAKMTAFKLVAFANPSDPSTFVKANPPDESRRKAMSLRDFLVSLDSDFLMWKKRYSWEQITEDGEWRRYYEDVSPLVEFIDLTMDKIAELRFVV